MPFHYSGVLRKAQWIAFRNFSLNERKSISSRIRAINSELSKIGRVTVIYEKVSDSVLDPSGAEVTIQTVSEKRRGFIVSSRSSLEKLIQSYIAAGGNPTSISLFLQPDTVQWNTDLDPVEDPSFNPNQGVTDIGFPSVPFDQPYGGVVAPKSTDSYGVGGRFQGGLPTFVRDPFTKIGRFIDLSDASTKISNKMDFSKRWVQKEIKELNLIESRIIKLCDLREQLLKERDEVLVQAIGGTVPEINLPDSDRFAWNLHLTKIVEEMDRTFFEISPEGVPDFNSIRLGDANNPSGISNFDTLFEDDPNEDTFSTG